MANKDKEKIIKICKDCGRQIKVTHGHARRKDSNYHWRCKECMKKYRSELMKSSDTNIGNYVKDQLSTPEKAKEYYEELSKRAIKLWEQLTDEEKIEKIDKLQKGHKEKYKNLTDEEKYKIAQYARDYYVNRTEDEKKKVSEKISSGRKRYFASLTDKEREQLSADAKERWENKTDEEKKAVSQHTIEQWANMDEKTRKKMVEHLQSICINRWNNMTDEERTKLSITLKEHWKNLSEVDKEKFRKKQIDRWKKIDHKKKYQLLKKSAMKSNGKNNLHKQFESYFMNSILSEYFYIEPEFITHNNGVSHSWDYGIFDENGELDTVIDLDGSYHHADSNDYNGLQSKEQYDEKRMLSAPDNVKTHIIYDYKFKDSFEDLIKLVKTDYDTFIENMFRYCRSIDFPYPNYSKSLLEKSWRDLCNFDNDSKYMNMSINTRLGDSLVKHFHPSIYHAHRKGKLSPYDAWYNDELLKKCIRNRVIYANHLNPNKILQGFNVSKIAPKVSVFSAGRAKLIIYRYLSEFDEIFDPFAGFGGRMLGALSLGKRYIGQDISDQYIHENSEIAKFLGMEDMVELSCKDVLNSKASHQCLLTCPPYADMEVWTLSNSMIKSCDDWITICLEHFQCQRYVFVVDETVKYKNNVVDIITNKSHLNNNQEYILYI